MADKTQMNGSNGRSAAPRAVVENLSDFLHDVVTLSELQAKLFVADLKDLRSGATMPAALMGAAAVFALGSVPILLMAIAWLLIDFKVLAHGWAFLVAAGVGIALAAVLGGVGWILLRKRLAVLERSQLELDRNVTWLKSVLKHSGRTTRDPKVVIPGTR